ncbi:MAG: hypothetical protein KME26_12835 [Oscillatoria princeps RMCB-10]|jgi:hypothetical protein|nr:hypothetical protein [Oscillatoria princeps RMCB-10]
MTEAQNTTVSTGTDSKGFSLTIYNQDFAVVREQRQIHLNQGANFVRYEDVAAQIDPTSISLKSLTAPNGVVVREQNYQYDLLNPSSILNKSVGKTVRFRRVNPDGQIEVLEGTLLNPPALGYNEDRAVVIRLSDGRIVLNPAGEIELNEMPEGLVSRPSLLWKLDVTEAADHTAEVSYLANGISWKADYVAVVNQEENQVDITGWVTLDNRSGATYPEAQLQLIAGDVRRVREPVVRFRNANALYAEAPQPQFQEEAFFEYHLYTLQGTTTVRDSETKQMTLLSAADVPVGRKLVYDGSKQPQWGESAPGEGGDTQQGKVSVVLELQNSQENNMGMPLPKGTVRVYKADARGNLQFLGEDSINHTPRNEKVRLYIGDSFDVVGERKRTSLEQISERVTEESFEISIRNRKQDSAEVSVVERFWGDWQIIKSSHEYSKVDARTAEFLVAVAADSEVKITYTVRTIR